MSNEKIFVDGMIVKRNDEAPDFAICKLSIKTAELIPFLQEHDSKGWVNIEVKRSKNGKYYAELDTWEPNRQEAHDQGMAQAKAAAETHASGNRGQKNPTYEPTGKASGSNDFGDIPFMPYSKGEFV